MRIGIDLGGTKIAGIALDEQGHRLAYERIPAASHDYDETIRLIVGLVQTLEGKIGQRGSIGIGTPGAISPATGLMRNSNSRCLNLKPLDRDLERALGREIRMANDADCFALSEAVDGAGRGAKSVFGVIIGTGAGSGIVIDGRLLTGPNAVAGEWGHNQLPWMLDDERPGRDCYCGKQGCVETFVSGVGFEQDYIRRGGEAIDGKTIVERARNGEVLAQASLDIYHDRLARALAGVINILDPHVIVLGGGMSNVDEIYTGVPQRWGDYVFSDKVHTKLLKHKHGDDSGTRGAAWLWPPKKTG